MRWIEYFLYFASNTILILLGSVLLLLKVSAIGGSLAAAGLVGVIMFWAVYINRKKTQEEERVLESLGKFGIVDVLPRRMTKREGHEFSGSARNGVDILGFGLGRFREDVSDGHLEKISKKVKIRILAVNPKGACCDERDYEENRKVGSIKEDVIELTKFVKGLNNKNIMLRWYRAIPSTHILRADNEMLVGAYIIGVPSRETYTLKLRSGLLFDCYAEHFDRIWNDPNLSSEPEYDKL